MLLPLGMNAENVHSLLENVGDLNFAPCFLNSNPQPLRLAK